MAKKTNFMPNFGPCGSVLVSQNLFRRFYLYEILDIVGSYYRMQFQEEIMIQTKENDEKSHFGPNLGSLGPDSSRQYTDIQTDGREW